MATILQVQYLNYTTPQNQVIPAGVWTDLTGLELSITPSSPLSVIRISAMLNGMRLLNNVPPLGIRVVRNGTPVGVGAGAGLSCYGRLFTSNFIAPYLYVDAPASIIALQYKLQVFEASGNTVYINTDSPAAFSGVSTLVLEEIG